MECSLLVGVLPVTLLVCPVPEAKRAHVVIQDYLLSFCRAQAQKYVTFLGQMGIISSQHHCKPDPPLLLFIARGESSSAMLIPYCWLGCHHLEGVFLFLLHKLPNATSIFIHMGLLTPHPCFQSAASIFPMMPERLLSHEHF
jgi:hypothetical protein